MGPFIDAIVIGLPMLRGVKIALTRHCGGPIRFACGLAESRVLCRSLLVGEKVCIISLTSTFNPVY